MRIHEIIARLDHRRPNVEEFCREMMIRYDSMPFTMRSDSRITNYLKRYDWFQDGQKFYHEFIHREYDRSEQPYHTQHFLFCNKVLSYLGNILDNDDFWIGLISQDPYLDKFYMLDSPVVKSIAKLLS